MIPASVKELIKADLGAADHVQDLALDLAIVAAGEEVVLETGKCHSLVEFGTISIVK